jgi:hypothetical protein
MVLSTKQISRNYFTENYVVSLILLHAAVLYVWAQTKEIFREIKNINVYDDCYLHNTGCKYYMSPTQNIYYTDFSINRFSTKEA